MARKEALPEGMDRQSGSLRVRVRVIGFEPISATLRRPRIGPFSF
jgi:hypothetical protein